MLMKWLLRNYDTQGRWAYSDGFGPDACLTCGSSQDERFNQWVEVPYRGKVLTSETTKLEDQSSEWSTGSYDMYEQRSTVEGYDVRFPVCAECLESFHLWEVFLFRCRLFLIVAWFVLTYSSLWVLFRFWVPTRELGGSVIVWAFVGVGALSLAIYLIQRRLISMELLGELNLKMPSVIWEARKGAAQRGWREGEWKPDIQRFFKS